MDLEVQKLLEKADGNFAIFDSVAKAHSVLSRYDSIACYTKYGMTRTGCVGCPFNRKLLDELSIIEEHEPKMLKAVSHVFKDSYEYTRMFREYVQKRKNEEKERTK